MMRDDEIRDALYGYVDEGAPNGPTTERVLKSLQRRRRNRLLGALLSAFVIAGGATAAFIVTDQNTTSDTTAAVDTPKVAGTKGGTTHENPLDESCGVGARSERFAISQPVDHNSGATNQPSTVGDNPREIADRWIAPVEGASVEVSQGAATAEAHITDRAGDTINILRMSLGKIHAGRSAQNVWRIVSNVVCLLPDESAHAQSPCDGRVLGPPGGPDYRWPRTQPEHTMGVAQYIGQATIPACAVLYLDAQAWRVRGSVAPLTLYTESELTARDSALMTRDDEEPVWLDVHGVEE